MSKVNKGGRVPSSVKQEAAVAEFTQDDFDINLLKIDAELRAELEGKQFDHRWINLKQYTSSGNFHKSGWKAYKSNKKSEPGSLDFNYGVSPDGYYIRGDLVLAVKPKKLQELHRQRLRAKTLAQSGKNYADEMREKFRANGVSADVLDGYEENDGD